MHRSLLPTSRRSELPRRDRGNPTARRSGSCPLHVRVETAVSATAAPKEKRFVRSVGPNSVAKGPAIDWTNRTHGTYKSYLSYWSRCTIVAPSSNERQNNGGKTISGCDCFAPIVLPDRATPTQKRGDGRLHRPPRRTKLPLPRRSDSPPARMKFTSVSPKLARLTRSSPYSHVQWPPQSKSPWPVFDAPASAAGAGMRTCGKCSGA